MIIFFLKRVVNTAVTVVFLTYCSFFLFEIFFLVGKWMIHVRKLEQGTFLFGAGFLVSLISFSLGFCCMYGICKTIVTGSGLIWKRIYRDSCLLENDGRVFFVYKQDELVWRWNTIFLRKRLVVPESEWGI